jgi:hypothetical protein
MDQAPNHPSPDGTARLASAALPPTASAWENFYREASRRRRANGGYRNLRVEKRRRRMRERLGVGISALFVGGLTMLFYLLLR